MPNNASKRQFDLLNGDKIEYRFSLFFLPLKYAIKTKNYIFESEKIK